MNQEWTCGVCGEPSGMLGHAECLARHSERLNQVVPACHKCLDCGLEVPLGMLGHACGAKLPPDEEQPWCEPDGDDSADVEPRCAECPVCHACDKCGLCSCVPEGERPTEPDPLMWLKVRSRS
jgi:hypothetical protein